ncbi:hypothetical protein NIK97_20545 [Brucella pseudintermedia]|uniref:Uncharacterized protein n=1 Tax=Brucella pseudintermedia TaxID=370111 RepID=A0ABY5UG06_9HYPH|nr:hypothetical protein [Brucella pseudintermedia]UWL62241.1 hypothetical protein NIK97_20545 [Brucella pseudintermedia]
MPSKELTHEELKAIVAAKMADPNTTAADILSTIRAAISEPTEAMLEECSDTWRYGQVLWPKMLAASALGEQSE